MTVSKEKDELTKLNYSNGHPISHLMDVFTFDDEGFFHTINGRFMRMWRINAFPDDVLSDEHKKQVSFAFQNVLSYWPEESDGQIVRISHRDIRSYVDRFAEGATNEGFSRDILNAIVDRQINAATKGFFDNVSDEMIKHATDDMLSEINDPDQKENEYIKVQQTSRQGEYPLVHDLYLILLWEPPKSLGRMIGSNVKKALGAFGLLDIDKEYKRAYEKSKLEFLGYARDIQNSLLTSNFEPEIITGQGLVEVLYREFNPVRSFYVDAPKYVRRKSIRQCLTEIEEEKKNGKRSKDVDSISRHAAFSIVNTSPLGWQIENMHFRAVTAKLPPNSTYPGMLYDAMIRAEGEGWGVINFHVLNQAIFRNTTLKVKQMSTKSQATAFENVPLLQPDPEIMERKLDDIQTVQTAINPENMDTKENIVDASIHVIVKDIDEKKAEQRAYDLEKLLWNAGYYEQTRGEAIVHHCVPGNYRHSATQLLQRDVPYITSNIADIAPLFTGYNGVPSAAILVNNTQGTPCFVDFFGKQVAAPHGLIVGGTGSGKSFAFNTLLMNMSGKSNPKTFIVDKGRSYESLCRTRGGTYIDMVTDDSEGVKPVCMNPFYIPPTNGERRLPNKTEQQFVRFIVISMIISDTNEKYITKSESSLLLEAILATYNKYGLEREVTLSDFVEVLADYEYDDASGASLARRLYEFTQKGVYGAMFDGPIEVDWDADIIVFETEKMATSPALSVAILVLFFQIEQYVKSRKPASRQAIFAIDEAWAMLANPTAAKSVAGFYRELRKYSTMCLLISQTIQDFVSLISLEGGGGILENTKHFILLSCTANDHRLAKEYLNLTDEEIQAWANISSLPPFYSEIFYRQVLATNESYSGIIRLYSNPIALWIATTQPNDKQVRQERTDKFIEEGYEPGEARRRAVVELGKEFPFGSQF